MNLDNNQLLILLALLFILYYIFTNIKEKFIDSPISTRNKMLDNRACSQKDINNAISSYILGTDKFVPRDDISTNVLNFNNIPLKVEQNNEIDFYHHHI